MHRTLVQGCAVKGVITQAVEKTAPPVSLFCVKCFLVELVESTWRGVLNRFEPAFSGGVPDLQDGISGLFTEFCRIPRPNRTSEAPWAWRAAFRKIGPDPEDVPSEDL